jgi:putative FmdB family regulatory protein
MPIYEYVCEKDGAVIELLRPMADADKPVADPDGKDRIFTRKHSTFATSGQAAGGNTSLKQGSCACGKRHGGCGAH